MVERAILLALCLVAGAWLSAELSRAGEEAAEAQQARFAAALRR